MYAHHLYSRAERLKDAQRDVYPIKHESCQARVVNYLSLSTLLFTDADLTTCRVLESISAGKKLAESLYRVLDSETQNTIKTFAHPVAAVKDEKPTHTNTDLRDIQDSEDESGGERTCMPSSAPEAGTAEGAIFISSSQ